MKEKLFSKCRRHLERGEGRGEKEDEMYRKEKGEEDEKMQETTEKGGDRGGGRRE